VPPGQTDVAGGGAAATPPGGPPDMEPGVAPGAAGADTTYGGQQAHVAADAGLALPGGPPGAAGRDQGGAAAGGQPGMVSDRQPGAPDRGQPSAAAGRQPGAAGGVPAAGDQPGVAGGVPASGVAGDQHVFQRGSWRWDFYFALVLAVTLALLSVSGAPTPQPAIAAAAVLAMAVLYLVIGRRAIADRASVRTATVFVIGLVLLFSVAQGLDSNSGWVLFALCPLCFMAVPLRRAIPAVLVLTLTPVIFLAEPARRGEGQVIAVLTIAVTSAAFAIAFGTWVTRIIDQSVERAELIGRLEAAQAELAEANHQAGTLAERQRLAGEIHDTLAQGLTSILMLLQAAEPKIATDPDEARQHLELASQTAREGLAEARAMVAALTPTQLESDTLPGALRRLTERIGAELAVDARFDLRGDARPLPATVEVVLLRVGQEALANVRKHSGAQRVQVTLSYGDGAARLEVADDGTGFDPGQVNGGYGLRGMRGRILQAGGSFDVRTQPGAGTALSVEVPC
jgi:signal transduction histidine kinase